MRQIIGFMKAWTDFSRIELELYIFYINTNIEL